MLRLEPPFGNENSRRLCVDFQLFENRCNATGKIYNKEDEENNIYVLEPYYQNYVRIFSHLHN